MTRLIRGMVQRALEADMDAVKLYCEQPRQV
jgi:peptide subunit release factor 1 (eRF1)